LQTLILAAGSSFINSTDLNYPAIMTEFNGKPLVQWILEDIIPLKQKNIVIVVNQEDINRFHIDRTIKLIEPMINVVGVPDNLGGAACSALIGLQFLNQEGEVVIINGNEKLTENHTTLMNQIYQRKAAASVVSFDSVHPRYSYAKIDSNQNVIEVSEKDPISRNALVGFFWFSQVSMIDRAIKRMILKDSSLNEVFYLSPAINELILEDLAVSMIKVDNSKYHPMKSEWQLSEYAKSIDRSR
jgi:dTDP-glucose pyrophosphorylase